jgi:hypothetical protein
MMPMPYSAEWMRNTWLLKINSSNKYHLVGSGLDQIDYAGTQIVNKKTAVQAPLKERAQQYLCNSRLRKKLELVTDYF